MIAVFILILMAGIIGIKISDILVRTRFKQSLKIIQQETEKLQLLALTYGSDMALSFFQEKGNWKLKIETNEAVLKPLQGRVISLKEVVKIDWYLDIPHSNASQYREPLRVAISSNGNLYPQGILQVQGKKEKAFLNLKYPLLVELNLSRESLFKQENHKMSVDK